MLFTHISCHDMPCMQKGSRKFADVPHSNEKLCTPSYIFVRHTVQFVHPLTWSFSGPYCTPKQP